MLRHPATNNAFDKAALLGIREELKNASERRGYLTRSRLTRITQESLDVRCKFGVVLEQEPVRRVGVDLHPGLRDQPASR